MSSVLTLAKSALDTLSPTVPHALDVMLTESADLPDVYIVFFEVTGVPQQHADNAETQRTFRVQVSIYSRSGLASLPDVDTAMLAAGFRRGPERQLPYDADTRHHGLAKDYFYLQ